MKSEGNHGNWGTHLIDQRDCKTVESIFPQLQPKQSLALCRHMTYLNRSPIGRLLITPQGWCFARHLSVVESTIDIASEEQTAHNGNPLNATSMMRSLFLLRRRAGDGFGLWHVRYYSFVNIRRTILLIASQRILCRSSEGPGQMVDYFHQVSSQAMNLSLTTVVGMASRTCLNGGWT